MATAMKKAATLSVRVNPMFLAAAKNDVAQMYRVLSEFLADADAHDYIMICSLATLCSVASAIMAANHGEVHFLVYQNGKYHVKDLIL